MAADPGATAKAAEGHADTLTAARAAAPGRSLRVSAVLAVVVIAAALPLFVTGFRLFQFTQVLIYAIALLGLNLLTGYNGQFSLGHGAFYGIGAYTSAVMIDRWGIGYGWTIPAAGVVCLIVGFLFGRPALRLEGLYLALATFSLALAVPQILKYFEHWTGGSQGIVLVAIRDNHIAAEAMGVNNALYKSVIFGVSAAYTGIAGALSAIVVAFVAPDSFDVFLSITLLTGIVIGGFGTISGPIYGALFIQFVPNWAQDISKAAPWAIFGLFLIGCMYVMPRGIAGFLHLVWIRLTRHAVSRGDGR